MMRDHSGYRVPLGRPGCSRPHTSIRGALIWPRNLMWPSTGSKMVSQPFFALTSHVLTCGFLISLIRCILNPPYAISWLQSLFFSSMR